MKLYLNMLFCLCYSNSSRVLGGNGMNILGKIRDLVGEPTENNNYSSHVVLLEIEKYEEIGKVATYLTEEKSIIINAKLLSDEDVERVISFLEGALFVIRGEMKQLDEKTFLCVPNSVAIVDSEGEEPTLEAESANRLDEELKERQEKEEVIEE